MANSDEPLILIVDDEADFLEIFSHKLMVSGFRVDTANSGEEGLAKAQSLKPDLVLMDVMMPGMDGATTMLQLRNNPETRDIKVVFLTSLGDPRLDLNSSDEKFSQSFGAGGYLKKTDDLEILVAKVKEFLKEKHS